VVQKKVLRGKLAIAALFCNIKLNFIDKLFTNGEHECLKPIGSGVGLTFSHAGKGRLQACLNPFEIRAGVEHFAKCF